VQDINVSLTVVIVGLLSVCCVSFITVFRPHLLWLAVVIVVSLFAVICVICNFITLGINLLRSIQFDSHRNAFFLGVPIGFITIATVIATQFMVVWMIAFFSSIFIVTLLDVSNHSFKNPHHERLPISTFVVFVLLFFVVGGMNQSDYLHNHTTADFNLKYERRYFGTWIVESNRPDRFYCFI